MLQISLLSSLLCWCYCVNVSESFVSYPWQRQPLLSRKQRVMPMKETNSNVDTIESLKTENEQLRRKIELLEDMNSALEKDSHQSKVIIETFEGEGQLKGDGGELWCDELDLDEGVCPIEPDVSFADALRDRSYWLVGLLAFQSVSSFFLSRNEDLLQTHPFIVYFLTMLVGAGGNAGNQASVRVIRGIALGAVNEKTYRQFLEREFKMAVCLSVILSLAGFVRAALFRTPLPETLTVAVALAMIVFTSICIGALLPLLLKRLGVDPAHSSTSIQVVMDLLGVVLTVFVSEFMLESVVGRTILSKVFGTQS